MSWGSLASLHSRAAAGLDGAELRLVPAPPRRPTLRSAASHPVSDRRPTVEVVPGPAALDELLRCYLEAGEGTEGEEDEAPPDTDRMLDRYEAGREDVDGYLREVRRG